MKIQLNHGRKHSGFGVEGLRRKGQQSFRPRVILHEHAQHTVGLGIGHGYQAIRHFLLHHEGGLVNQRSGFHQFVEDGSGQVIRYVPHKNQPPGIRGKKVTQIQFQEILLNQRQIGHMAQTFLEVLDQVPVDLDGGHKANPVTEARGKSAFSGSDLDHMIVRSDAAAIDDGAYDIPVFEEMLAPTFPGPVSNGRRGILHGDGLVLGCIGLFNVIPLCLGNSLPRLLILGSSRRGAPASGKIRGQSAVPGDASIFVGFRSSIRPTLAPPEAVRSCPKNLKGIRGKLFKVSLSRLNYVRFLQLAIKGAPHCRGKANGNKRPCPCPSERPGSGDESPWPLLRWRCPCIVSPRARTIEFRLPARRSRSFA